jgi:hypothetical protein
VVEKRRRWRVRALRGRIVRVRGSIFWLLLCFVGRGVAVECGCCFWERKVDVYSEVLLEVETKLHGKRTLNFMESLCLCVSIPCPVKTTAQ